MLMQMCGQWFVDMRLRLSSNFGNLYINEGKNFRYLTIYILMKETIFFFLGNNFRYSNFLVF